MRSRVSLAALALALGACGSSHGQLQAASGGVGYDETGVASWYGDEAAGSLTASGVRFDPDAITVAHRTLPLGSFVALTSLETGRTIVAIVTDRGPGRSDRLVDLSRGAAHQLGTDQRPLSRIRVRAVTASRDEADALRAGRPAVPRASGTAVGRVVAMPVSATGRYVVRIATFSNYPRALALANAVGAQIVAAGGLWRVILGPYEDASAAQRARDVVARHGYGDAAILAQD